jgi:hypothetical protein
MVTALLLLAGGLLLKGVRGSSITIEPLEDGRLRMQSFGYRSPIVLTVLHESSGVFSDFRLLESRESPLYASQADIREYLSRLEGRGLDEIRQVDGITGATVTTDAIRQALLSTVESPFKRWRPAALFAFLWAGALAFSLAKGSRRRRNLFALLAGGACFAVFGVLYNAPVSIYRLFQLRGAFLLPALLALASALLYRNLYCRTICPFGFLQRIAGLLPLPRKRRLPPVLRSGRYILLAMAVASAAMATQLYLEPYAYLFSRRPAWWLYIFPAVVLAVSAFIPRFWCAGFCPLGAALRIAAEIRGFFLKGTPPSLGLSFESRPGSAWLALLSFGCLLVSNLLLFALL